MTVQTQLGLPPRPARRRHSCCEHAPPRSCTWHTHTEREREGSTRPSIPNAVLYTFFDSTGVPYCSPATAASAAAAAVPPVCTAKSDGPSMGCTAPWGDLAAEADDASADNDDKPGELMASTCRGSGNGATLSSSDLARRCTGTLCVSSLSSRARFLFSASFLSPSAAVSQPPCNWARHSTA
jgi:hypothetical protein